MNRFFAVPLVRRVHFWAPGVLIGALAAGWPQMGCAGNYVDVEPEVSSHASRPAPPVGPAATQLLPDAVPPWQRSGTATAAHAHEVAVKPAPAKKTAAHAVTAAPPQSGSTTPPAAAATGAGDAALSQSPLAVTRWSLNGTAEQQPDGGLTIAAVAGRPLYLKFTIEGGGAAVDRLRSDGRLAIEVHWARSGDAAAAGAPTLTTELTIGRPELVGLFASQVQKQGHFEWHMWARKDALSPGQWTVSLTYPDGTPVQCGEAQPQPCRLAVNAG